MRVITGFTLKRSYLVFSMMLASTSAMGEIASFRFVDKVSKDGIGVINLLTPDDASKTSNGASLEAFRNDNNGELAFAVDISEPSSGSETLRSHGVALESVRLLLTFPTEVVEFTVFSSATHSFLKKSGALNAVLTPTLIGNSDTTRVSTNPASEMTGSSWDSVFRVAVDRPLTEVVAAELHIDFFDVDKQAGDPEEYYDFAGRDEIVALLSADDANYLDTLAPGRDEAPLVLDASGASLTTWTYLPSSSGYFIASYEDLFPLKGDYDFNDLVVAYQVALGSGSNEGVSKIRGSGYLIARGAAYDHDWYLRIGLPAWASGSGTTRFYESNSDRLVAGFPASVTVRGDVNLLLAEHIADHFSDGESTYVNTFEAQTVQEGPRFEFSLDLDVPVPAEEISAAPFDPFIYVHETGYEVHLADQAPVLAHSRNTLDGATTFRDTANFPFAMIVPDDFAPPLAAVDIGLAYPTFLDYVQSMGDVEQDWYLKGQSHRVKEIPFKQW